tara:strand:+ start:74 stop:352 length:279 start_codon:yes stop_codon:yes gene_type:complete
MKVRISSIAIALLMLFSINTHSLSRKAETEPWLTSSEYALVWAYVSLDSIERHGCCVESSEHNACGLSYQTNQSLCKAGRVLGFAEVWDIDL